MFRKSNSTNFFAVSMQQTLLATMLVSLTALPHANAQQQIFDDGSSLQMFDDGSTLAIGTDGSTSSIGTDGSRISIGADGTRTETAAPGAEQAATCESVSSTAKAACLMPGTGGMSAGEAAMYTMMMNQLVSSAATIASIGKNMSEQCKVQADVAKIMTGINGVKGAACATLISKCESTCTTEASNRKNEANTARTNNNYAMATTKDKEAAAATKSASTCAGYSGQVMGMMMSAMQSMGNFATSKQCQADAAALAAAVPTYSPIAMPTIGDCTDPNNQSLTCYCTKEANKSSVMCAGFTSGGVAGTSTTTTPNGTSVATPYSSSVADLTDSGNTADPFAGQNKKNSGGPSGQGDGGSGAPGGGGLSSLASEGGGSGGTGDGRSAITGTSGGNGTLGSAGGGGGGGLARNNGTAGSGGSLMDKFNLKNFLPGSKYKTRGIAGMSVKSVDGITGPTGPSLWEKATRQYQEQIQKQNVILDGK